MLGITDEFDRVRFVGWQLLDNPSEVLGGKYLLLGDFEDHVIDFQSCFLSRAIGGDASHQNTATNWAIN